MVSESKGLPTRCNGKQRCYVGPKVGGPHKTIVVGPEGGGPHETLMVGPVVRRSFGAK